MNPLAESPSLLPASSISSTGLTLTTSTVGSTALSPQVSGFSEWQSTAAQMSQHEPSRGNLELGNGNLDRGNLDRGNLDAMTNRDLAGRGA
eukprot:69849-Prorocentrum_minimum.AAC.1